MAKQYERGFAQPINKAPNKSAPIADADKDRRTALLAFRSGDAVSEITLDPA